MVDLQQIRWGYYWGILLESLFIDCLEGGSGEIYKLKNDFCANAELEHDAEQQINYVNFWN